MTSGFFSGDFLRGLTFRVLFFLSLALLPIGLIAVSQTQQIAEQNRLNAELSLLAITEQAATAEAAIVQRALGAAEALASIVGLYRDSLEQCQTFLRGYEDANPSYTLVGFIPTDGLMQCSSAETPFDFSQRPDFRESVANPHLRIRNVQSGALSGRPVIMVTFPVFDGDTLEGFIAISIPSSTFAGFEEPALPLAPLALMTYSKEGEILISEPAMELAGDELPMNVALSVFTEAEPTVFEAVNQNGETRVYATRRIVQDAVFAVSVWPTDSPVITPSILSRLAALVPVAMWLASLLVAFWALNRLAIRHIGKLRRQMQRFAINRDLPRNTLGQGVPTELIEMESTFIRMGESILRDEATLEDSLREKNILLKEVHHRVKNNLQLISSIMNMQIRQAKSADARLVLERLQQRILGLATVHKNLYQTNDLIQVDAQTLLREVVDQLLSVGLGPGSDVAVKQEYADVTLEPDDAAPLTLLVSEGLTNALKHVPYDGGKRGRIDIALTHVDGGYAELVLSNSKGGSPPQGGTGLGFGLINAFARQLNGDLKVEETDDLYSLRMVFPVADRARPVMDF